MRRAYGAGQRAAREKLGFFGSAISGNKQIAKGPGASFGGGFVSGPASGNSGNWGGSFIGGMVPKTSGMRVPVSNEQTPQDESYPAALSTQHDTTTSDAWNLHDKRQQLFTSSNPD